MSRNPPVGASLEGDACTFCVWAPHAGSVAVRMLDDNRVVAMDSGERGYFSCTVDRVRPGARYVYVLDGERELPDPASRHQPDGVHGPSAVVARTFDWSDDDWRAPELGSLVIYELHVGTFTPQGNFDGVATQFDRLRDLGINTVELLPIAQFPGSRNWGYDGVFPFAVQNSYGGPIGLKRMIDLAHRAGLAVALDVVYNHLGPEGNYLSAYAPYFTDRYRTPWGSALNFDDHSSDEVRSFFIQSALQWVDEFHVDVLRFDAVHAIVDASAQPFLAELTDALHNFADDAGRIVHLIAESDLSDPRVIRCTSDGGLGFDAQWLDDFHHALHALVTGETDGYYRDYGDTQHVVRALQQAYVYAGDYSEHRGRRHGAPLDRVDPRQFVVFAQNHDQIGNRMEGDRLSTLVSFDQLKLLAAFTLLSPYVPLLFMGEEYGETRPFPFFVSHGDPELVEAVRKGRRAEFAAFGWAGEPPDPQGEHTFESAILDPSVATHGENRTLLDLHRDLIALRSTLPLIREYDEISVDNDADQVLRVERTGKNGAVIMFANFAAAPQTVTAPPQATHVFSTADPKYAAHSDPNGAHGARDAHNASANIVLPPTSVLLLQVGAA